MSFKIAAGDLMSVFSHDFADIIFYGSLVIFEAISYYGAQKFTLHTPRVSLPFYLITCSSPHSTGKDGDTMHSPGHFILTYGDDFTSHGSMFKAATSQLLGFTSHGSNSQAHFLSH